MGICASGELSQEQLSKNNAEAARSKAIDGKMHQDQKEQDSVHKLLLLGTGDSGKSTLFRQMIIIYGEGFSEKQLRDFNTVVCGNVIVSLRQLVNRAKILYPEMEMKSAMIYNDKDLPSDTISPEVAELLKAVWNEPAIQKTWLSRLENNFLIETTNIDHFMAKIDQIASTDWIPTVEDVLKTRARTTGIVEQSFSIKGSSFRMFDVGGQRNERKKWVHSFEGVTAVLFVVAVSEYDQMLYEDQNTNRMVEAMNVFEEICSTRWFAKTSIILFLNKSDLLREKIQRVPLSKYFPDYKGPEKDFDAGCEFISSKFIALDKRQQNEHQGENYEDTLYDDDGTQQMIYTHVTNATDTTMVEFVFNAVKDIIIQLSLKQAGLLC